MILLFDFLLSFKPDFDILQYFYRNVNTFFKLFYFYFPGFFPSNILYKLPQAAPLSGSRLSAFILKLICHNNTAFVGIHGAKASGIYYHTFTERHLA